MGSRLVITKFGAAFACLLLVAGSVMFEMHRQSSQRRLMDALQTGAASAAMQLLSTGVRPKIGAETDIRGSALMLAVECGDAELLRQLLDVTPITRYSESQKCAALEVVIYKSKSDLCKILLNAGVSANCRSTWQTTPLHQAALQGSGEICQLLILYHADVNSIAENGTTPIHFAAQKGFIKVVKMLADAGADIEATNSHGMTALQIAEANGFQEIIKELKSRKK